MVKLQTQNSKLKTRRRGAALLVVLFMIMAVVVISLGILYRADMAAAGGHNYALRTQADYIAWAGLEHARALILTNPEATNRPTITNMLFTLDNEFFYELKINDPQIEIIPHRYEVNCTTYYNKPEATTHPYSQLKATVLYEDDPASKKAWFTNIRRSQE